MKKKLLSVLVLFTAVSLACSTVTGLVPSGTPGNETPAAVSVQADGLSAEVVEAGSVLLKWEPINGAEHYLVEVQLGDEFVPLAVLPADQVSYEDRNVPPATRFTYRLSSLVNTEQGQGKEITIETPQESGDPLKVSFEFDQAPPLFDPSTFDPNSIDPDTFDPDKMDPAMFAPQPVQAEAVIGPEGGELSVTGSNGVIYTLSVPPDALRFEMPITLRPVSAIPDLPLSGGLMAAVLVEPNSLVFDIPATLTMFPPVDFPAPVGPLVIAFAFEADGQEFHLYPLDVPAEQSRLGGHLASLRAGAGFMPPLSEIVALRDGGVYGEGSGTGDDVQEITKKPPSKPKNRTTQRLAVGQLDDLAPLLPIPDDLVGLTPLPPGAKALGEVAESILQKAGQIDDWGKLMEALDDFSTYIDAGGDKFNKKLNDKILDLLVDQAKKLLDKNKGSCLTQDDFKAQEFIERLTNPKDGFSKTLAERFKQKHGQQVLVDLAKAKVTCSFELSMNSTLTLEAEGSTLHAVASLSKIKLFPTYSKGKIYLTGVGAMKQDFRVSGICSFPLKHYDGLTFSVGKLTPIFDKDGVLVDFNLSEYAVHGWDKGKNVSLTVKKNDDCPTMIQLKGGGDYWTGLFIGARFSLGNQSIIGWEVQTNMANGNSFHSLDADWESVNPSFVPMGVAGTISSEDTKFKLKITKTSK